MKKTKKLVFSALLAALVCVSTLIIVVTLPGGGYFNLGDCFVIASGVILGPLFGFLSASIGSGLADIISGYVLYAPATFIIKGLMALVVGFICLKNKKMFNVFLSGILAEIIMIIGYFLYELALNGFSLAILGVTGNALQGVAGVVSSFVLVLLLTKNKAINKFITQ